MKHTVGMLYLLTAALGLYWSIYLTMTGMYGLPFSRWFVVVFIGGLVLLLGAIFWWTSARAWTRWLPIIGSGMLAAYFLPAFVSNIQEFMDAFSRPTTDRVLALGSVLLAITSLVVAVRNRHVPAT
ncbi:MAG: hypothetical protein AB7O65_12140 [Candidatus Korobacteraceae bacterium]